MNTLAFALPAIGVLIGAIGVVASRDLVRSVLWLAVVLFATAIVFVTLGAGFIAAVQVLLYTGGVITLMLFGVMLTHRVDSARILHDSHHRGRGAAIALALFALMASAITGSTALERIGATGATLAEVAPIETAAVGEAFLTTWMLPFEVLSALLLAVMIGAIVLARKEDAR